ncbi:hypothetical protein GQ42DRAFT_177965 [Ramicandelaber brevisporus]|nr:hypothetical protein GQ42DRAFT_177965 [Ramicandelaber brevisporus]
MPFDQILSLVNSNDTAATAAGSSQPPSETASVVSSSGNEITALALHSGQRFICSASVASSNRPLAVIATSGAGVHVTDPSDPSLTVPLLSLPVSTKTKFINKPAAHLDASDSGSLSGYIYVPVGESPASAAATSAPAKQSKASKKNKKSAAAAAAAVNADTAGSTATGGYRSVQAWHIENGEQKSTSTFALPATFAPIVRILTEAASGHVSFVHEDGTISVWSEDLKATAPVTTVSIASGEQQKQQQQRYHVILAESFNLENSFAGKISTKFSTGIAVVTVPADANASLDEATNKSQLHLIAFGTTDDDNVNSQVIGSVSISSALVDLDGASILTNIVSAALVPSSGSLHLLTCTGQLLSCIVNVNRTREEDTSKIELQRTAWRLTTDMDLYAAQLKRLEAIFAKAPQDEAKISLPRPDDSTSSVTLAIAPISGDDANAHNLVISGTRHGHPVAIAYDVIHDCVYDTCDVTLAESEPISGEKRTHVSSLVVSDDAQSFTLLCINQYSPVTSEWLSTVASVGLHSTVPTLLSILGRSAATTDSGSRTATSSTFTQQHLDRDTRAALTLLSNPTKTPSAESFAGVFFDYIRQISRGNPGWVTRFNKYIASLPTDYDADSWEMSIASASASSDSEGDVDADAMFRDKKLRETHMSIPKPFISALCARIFADVSKSTDNENDEDLTAKSTEDDMAEVIEPRLFCPVVLRYLIDHRLLTSSCITATGGLIPALIRCGQWTLVATALTDGRVAGISESHLVLVIRTWLDMQHDALRSSAANAVATDGATPTPSDMDSVVSTDLKLIHNATTRFVQLALHAPRNEQMMIAAMRRGLQSVHVERLVRLIERWASDSLETVADIGSVFRSTAASTSQDSGSSSSASTNVVPMMDSIAAALSLVLDAHLTTLLALPPVYAALSRLASDVSVLGQLLSLTDSRLRGPLFVFHARNQQTIAKRQAAALLRQQQQQQQQQQDSKSDAVDDAEADVPKFNEDGTPYVGPGKHRVLVGDTKKRRDLQKRVWEQTAHKGVYTVETLVW